jgi:hypothetical protein
MVIRLLLVFMRERGAECAQDSCVSPCLSAPVGEILMVSEASRRSNRIFKLAVTIQCGLRARFGGNIVEAC